MSYFLLHSQGCRLQSTVCVRKTTANLPIVSRDWFKLRKYSLVLSNKIRGSPFVFWIPFYIISAVFGQRKDKKITTERSGVHLWHCLIRKQWLLLIYSVNAEQAVSVFVSFLCVCVSQWKTNTWQVSVGLCCSQHKWYRWLLLQGKNEGNVTNAVLLQTAQLMCVLFCSACADAPLPVNRTVFHSAEWISQPWFASLLWQWGSCTL